MKVIYPKKRVGGPKGVGGVGGGGEGRNEEGGRDRAATQLPGIPLQHLDDFIEGGLREQVAYGRDGEEYARELAVAQQLDAARMYSEELLPVGRVVKLKKLKSAGMVFYS